jgi:hypothetical protein
MDIAVNRLQPDEWKVLAEKAHLVVFNEKREAEINRIDFALLCLLDGTLQTYVTVKEMDAESLYWQYGGAFPTAKKSLVAFRCFQKLIEYCFDEGYKRISLYVKNDNFSMLKFVMSHTFTIVGMRTIAGDTFLEFNKELRSN